MTGTTTCAVGDHEGQVVLRFPEAVEWAAFDPETARQIGEAMARSAYKIAYGREAATGSVVNQQVLARLINQTTHLVKKLQDQGVKPAIIANEIVTLVLSEVT